MKKIALVIALIAMLVGATYGGVAFAGKPIGSAMVMDRVGGEVDVAVDAFYRGRYPIYSVTYTEIRHVHLTFNVLRTTEDMPAAQRLIHDVMIILPEEQLALIDHHLHENPTWPAEETYVYEFDAIGWSLETFVDNDENNEPTSYTYHYAATITYPR